MTKKSNSSVVWLKWAGPVTEDGWSKTILCCQSSLGLPWWRSWWRIRLQCRRPGFHPSVGKIPWRREWLPTPVFWPRGFTPTHSMGLQRVQHGWATFTFMSKKTLGLSSRRIDAFELWCWRRLLRVPWTSRRSNQSILKEISPEYSLEGLVLKVKLPIFWPPDVKNWLIWKDRDAGKDWRQEKGMTRGWDGWMASLTWWTWVWVSSGSWWWTGKPSMLQSWGYRVGHDWATELNWHDWVKEISFFINKRNELLSGEWMQLLINS